MSEAMKKAAALSYEPGKDGAPRVVAAGSGRIADRIIALARENDICIHQDPALVEVLSKLDLKSEIPPELYIVVAEILSFVYTLDSGKNGR